MSVDDPLGSAIVRILGVLAVLSGCSRAAADGRTSMIDLPSASPARISPFAGDEETLAMTGARLLGGTLPPQEREHLTRDLAAAYRRMREAEGTVPSPFRQGTGPGPALVFEPRAAPTDTAIVFLHGYGGNFALQCWIVARAGDQIGARTICPGIGTDGDWWTRSGEEHARRAIDYARSRGARRVILAGLSNGGIGASLIAPRLGRAVDGLVLLSGVSHRARPAARPTLILHGTRDHMTPLSPARSYAANSHGRAQLRTFDSTHFLLIERMDEVRDAIAAWARRALRP